MEVTVAMQNGQCRLSVSGKIDSGNAKEFEDRALSLMEGENLLLDLKGLEYISSAGLRVILNFRKRYPSIELINASTEVYDVLEMTGFTEIMKVSRALKEISIEGAELIGKGANGAVYRMPDDSVVKVYLNGDSLAAIENERNSAKRALVLGIPTAISYDLVTVDGCYATVFEMLNCASLGQLLKKHPENIDEYAGLYVGLLQTIHGTEAQAGDFPDEKAIYQKYVDFLEPYLPKEYFRKLRALTDTIPASKHVIHGDYHVKNVMIQDGEAILIDMDTLALGDPLLELGFMYNAYAGYYLADPGDCLAFLGIDLELATDFWHKTLRKYASVSTEEELAKLEQKAKLVGLPRVMRKQIRKGASPEVIEIYRKELMTAIDAVDRLY